MTKQTPSQRKALRSAAARKGWETRRDKEFKQMAARHGAWAVEALGGPMKPYVRPAPHFTLGVDEIPDPTPGTPTWLHRLWAWIMGR